MASLRFSASGATKAPLLPVRYDTPTSGQDPARRSVSVMRKYEVSALLPDLSITQKSHVAPATPLFEETAGAFARGTLIQTVRGAVAIEDLLPGDFIETARGPAPVMWIGSTTYVPGVADDGSGLTRLTRVTADGFGLGRPMTDLLLGPAARMTLRRERLRSILGQDAVLAPVREYEDGDRIFSVEPGGSVQLYHLMLQQHAVIRVGGIEMDTYHPGKALVPTLGHNLRALYLSMFPNIEHPSDFGELSLPRTNREVIDSLSR
ncbi:Hint domain-containing protein [Thalassococcus sp. BH17M4-6]|uniref:Hint domain-containing protein n=1 Tax=Thalassococcus sp. BH17M4-6 TaxID=3413148 RepID=UPI003BC138F4